MSQHDMIISNADGATARADINAGFQALASTSKGTARPSTAYAGQLWLDDNTPSGTLWTLNVFDGTDDISIGQVDSTNNLFNGTFGSLTVSGTSVPANGVYLQASNILGLSSNSQICLKLDNSASSSIVNYFTMNGNTTGNNPVLIATGGDTNIGINYACKGTGAHTFYTNGTASQFSIIHTATAVNYLTVTGSASGNSSTTVAAAGGDSAISIFYQTKGGGTHNFYTSGTTLQCQIGHVASAVNYVAISGAATGSPSAVSISASGSDSNIDMALSSKGTGVLRFGTHTGSTVTHSGYITIKDSGGTTRKLMVGT